MLLRCREDDSRGIGAHLFGQVLAVLAIGLGGIVAAIGPDPVIESVIDSDMPASGVPGLAYAVVDGGTVTAEGARGVPQLGGDGEVTPETAFTTGSISKSFTALAVMQLVEEGKLDLDTPVASYVQDFAGRPAGAATIRQLLSHTSGYSTLQGNQSHGSTSGAPDDLAQLVEQLADVTPAYGPGEQWEYSNANYLVLGRLVEVVSGQDFQSYVTDKILAPVGMVHSFVSDGTVHESMAIGHTPWFWTKRPLDDNRTSRGMAPAGGIVASAGDMALYLRMMMNGEDDLLSAAGKAQMMSPASAVSPFYGFGWFIDSGNGTVWHDGSTPGVETLATMLPSQNKAVVVLVNGGSGIGFGETTDLRNAIAASALGLDFTSEGSRWLQKALFMGLVLLPFFYLLSMVWAWRHRDAIRAKSGVAGLFSLWFPLATTLAAAWVILWLMPTLLGAPLDTLRLFQPDLALALAATAVTGVLWAVFRLGVAYTGRSSPG